MFNTNKQDDLKDKATQLANSVKDDVAQVADVIMQDASDISHNVQQKTNEAKHEAMNLVSSLKSLLAQYTGTGNVEDLKNQIVDKALQLKNTVKDEVTYAYDTGKARTAHTVQEKPLLTLGLAVGAGVLLGYILGSKQSSK
jgi:ElaB/YqjD/DUF883 family membrane-anchored ribosome-binding protein